MDYSEPTEHRIAKGDIPEQNFFHADTIKKISRFRKFFSNVSSLSVSDTVSVETQLELMRALKEVE